MLDPFPLQIAFVLSGDKTIALRTSEGPDGDAGAVDADAIVLALASAVRRIFPGVPVQNVLGPVELAPGDRLRDQLSWRGPPDAKTVGPCGGFSAQYACLCDYFGLPFREEVAWDVDTIYYSHDSRELCLQVRTC